MSRTSRITLVVISGIALGALIFGAGVMVVKANWRTSGINPYPMIWNSGSNNQGHGMMGNGKTIMDGNDMMPGYQSGVNSNFKSLTTDQAKQAIESYLKGLNNPDLELKEIMIFDNNAYARIIEKSTGIGAMELLVDPVNLSVFPEYGPNMMWNLKYGHTPASAPRTGVGMKGNNMMSGSRNGMTLTPAPRAGVGGYNSNPGSVSATMTVTSEQATKIAQQYLDQQFPGYQAATDPDPFYGYYTIDILKDGKPTGMLSVNGFSGQVFLHTWHGTLIQVSE